MSPTFVALTGCVLLFTGFGLGVWAGYRRYKPPSDEKIAKYMTQVVNQEEVEEHKRLLRLQLMRAGRRTTRLDGGPPAKQYKMRIRPGKKGR